MRYTAKDIERIRRMGRRIAFFRKKNGLTQEQLAEKADVSTVYLSKVECQYEVAGLSLGLLFHLSDALHIMPGQLLDDEDWLERGENSDSAR